jgi:hypothetical protein
MIDMGTYDELLTSSTSFAQLLEDIHQYDQEQQTNVLSTQLSTIGSISSAKGHDDEINDPSDNIEIKQHGTVQWHVYLSYLRAGAGFIVSSCLILSILSAQQIVSIASNWWLALWSEDETRRLRRTTICQLSR